MYSCQTVKDLPSLLIGLYVVASSILTMGLYTFRFFYALLLAMSMLFVFQETSEEVFSEWNEK